MYVINKMHDQEWTKNLQDLFSISAKNEPQSAYNNPKKSNFFHSLVKLFAHAKIRRWNNQKNEL